jgi:glycosyltransferase involved in cell wall biosynthesis
LPFSSTVIENAYDDSVFVANQAWKDRRGMAFVGRLVSDKGVETVLQASRRLRERGHDLPVFIIGDGPLRADLEAMARRHGMQDSIRFMGKLPPAEVADLLNKVKYLAIPSMWAEPFGIVALEGIACGCIPLGTNGGGLIDAIGPCGPVFKPGDYEALADNVARLESDVRVADSFRSHFSKHLAEHSPDTIAHRYAEVFESVVRRK